LLLAIARYFRQAPSMTNDSDAEAWGRVARQVRGRREALNLTQEEAVARADGGISKPVWSLIENARQYHYKRRTLVAVCRALGWTPNSIDAILAGGAPIDELPAITVPSGRIAEAARQAREEAERREAAGNFTPELVEYRFVLIEQRLSRLEVAFRELAATVLSLTERVTLLDDDELPGPDASRTAE
jgi:hypothetical protein